MVKDNISLSKAILFFFVCISLGEYINLFFFKIIKEEYIIIFSIIIMIFYLYKKSYKKYRNIFFSIGIILISIIINGTIVDVSYDGQWYHMLTPIMINKGWNPIWDYNANLYSNISVNTIWSIVYPKSLEIFSSVFYMATGNILVGKFYNILLIVVNILLLKSFLEEKIFSKVILYLFIFVIVFNPVVSTQLWTYYVDGTGYLLILVILNLSYLKYTYSKINESYKFIDFLIIALSAIAINIKFTMVGYIPIILCGIGIMFYINKKEKIYLYFKTTILSLLVGILIVGYNPYVLNIMEHGNIFWPLKGENSVDIISAQGTKEFLEKNRLEKLGISILSKSRVDVSEPILKIPGSVDVKEITTIISVPDTRIGGWGPFFSLGIILSIILFVYMIYRKIYNIYFFISICVLLISTIVNPECWWARYVPQFYIIPIIILLYGEINKNFLGAKIKKFLYFSLCILVLNSALVLIGNIPYTVYRNYENYRFLINLKEYKNIEIYFDDFYTVSESRLKFFDLNYKKIDSPNMNIDPMVLPSTFNKVKIYILDK